MKLWQAAGAEVRAPELKESDDEARGLLAAEADRFVRAGGFVTLDDWRGLTADERAALVAARERVEVERAVRIGIAASGPRAAASVLSQIDGGEALEKFRDAELHVALEGEAARVAARVAESGIARPRA
jgi:hypothetical protein